MSTLQVSNVHLESSGNNRIQYTGSNTFNIVAAGQTRLSINSTSTSIGNVTVSGTANFSGVNTTSISVGGTAVVNSSAGLNNISAIDATTASAIEASISAGGDFVMTTFTTTGTWTKPANLKKVKVTVVAAGGDASGQSDTSTPANVSQDLYTGGGGGAGGAAIKYIPAPSIPGPVSVTVGVNAATRTSSFGAFCSATGGSNSPGTNHGGAGGAGSSGDLNITGQKGGMGMFNDSVFGPGSIPSAAGAGGASIFSGGYGSGGDGTSGTGSDGIVIVEEFY